MKASQAQKCNNMHPSVAYDNYSTWTAFVDLNLY